MNTVYSFWLVPEQSLKSRLGSIIRRLATNYDAVEFEPHVTIFSGSSDDDEIRDTAPGVASRFSVVELTPRKLDFSSSYTKTLFIDFYESAVARHMFDAIKHGTAQPSAYVLNPHLSLLYKTMPAAAQAEICGTLGTSRGRLCL